MSVELEYLTTAEAAKRIKYSARTMRAKIAAGVFREGVHFFQPPGCRPRWKWSAVVSWLEGERTEDRQSEVQQLRLARGGGKALLRSREP